MTRKAVPRRLISWVWDYLVVLAWLVAVFLAVGVPQLAGWIDLGRVWSRPLASDGLITVLTVLPYLAYLVATESAAAHATFGKRRAGLVVTRPPEGITLRYALLRNAVKVLPWQLGHMSAMRFATEPVTSALALGLFVASMLLLVAVVAPPLVGRRGLHDRLAGTDVRPRVGGMPPRVGAAFSSR